MKKSLAWSIWCCFILMLNVNCGTDDFAAARNKKIRVDTLTNNLIIKLRPEMDSLCALQRPELVQAAIDSIMPIRLQEIEEMLEN